MTDLQWDSLVGCIGPYSISAAHLKSLYEPGYIPDVVIDALMSVICKKYEDVYSVCTQSMTKILVGSQRAKSQYFCKKNMLKCYSKVIGAHLVNGNHWTLFFCDLKKQTITYMDPFGEEEERKNDIMKNWSSFAEAKGCTFEWTWTDVAHPQQEDGHSCGVHVLMFAQALLDGKTLVEGYTSAEIPQLRAQFCHTLFSSSDRAVKCTVCWGVLMKNKVCCPKCGVHSHLRCQRTPCGICLICSRGEGNVMFQHLQNQESKQTEESTRQTPDDKDQQGGEKRETYKTDKVEVKKDQSKGKKRKASHSSNRKEKQERNEERQSQNLDMDSDVGHESEEAEDIKGIKVFGRLALTGQKKTQYIVTEEEMQRRIKGENMSSNVFRDLLGGRKKNLPEVVRTLPKKMKTKTSIFSALTEGESSDLAAGLTKSLCQNVSPELVRKDISDQSAEVTRTTLTSVRANLQSGLDSASPFSLITHTFGPQAVDGVLGFIIDSLK
ncbi:hypothetical protein Q8A67_000167 [Cirrhinus molitorella]|uniref:Ubiquitin-like protease family profile domain-containing protein n=1 Tax=Cirrhinus molitorella TaxID=172907 RepID=A0AA88Q4V1_9TELE|nr:hypothetical protein Q8A67_000167 [Cirrhinus molitorella]